MPLINLEFQLVSSTASVIIFRPTISSPQFSVQQHSTISSSSLSGSPTISSTCLSFSHDLFNRLSSQFSLQSTSSSSSHPRILTSSPSHDPVPKRTSGTGKQGFRFTSVKVLHLRRPGISSNASRLLFLCIYGQLRYCRKQGRPLHGYLKSRFRLVWFWQRRRRFKHDSLGSLRFCYSLLQN